MNKSIVNGSKLKFAFLALASLVALSSPAQALVCAYGNQDLECKLDYKAPSTKNPVVAPPYIGYCGQDGKTCCSCETTRDNLANELDRHRREYVVGTYWTDTVYPGLRTVLNNIVASIVGQSTSLGGFIEAQNNVNTLASQQKLQAEAVNKFTPSEALCRYGSLSGSLAADDIRARGNQQALARINIRRDLGAEGTAGEAGRAGDVSARMNNFMSEYCDEGSNNNALGLMCGTSANRKRDISSIPADQRYNRDIDYTQTIEARPTLDTDFTSTAAASAQVQAGQQDVISLGQNLYGSSQLSERPTEGDMKDVDNQLLYMKTRSLTGIRGVAQNSYAAIAGMRARGSGKSANYINATLRSLGLPDQQIKHLMSENPSYFAQMEILTKKIYQSPAYYVNLMDSRTNVKRQTTSLESLQLMQDRDIYQSTQRSEMLLALLVQLQARRVLSATTTDINTIRGRTP